MKKIFLTLAAILLLAISNISNFNVFAVAISEYSTQTQHRSSINCFEGDPLEKIDYVGSPVGTISCNLSPTVSGDESGISIKIGEKNGLPHYWGAFGNSYSVLSTVVDGKINQLRIYFKGREDRQPLIVIQYGNGYVESFYYDNFDGGGFTIHDPLR